MRPELPRTLTGLARRLRAARSGQDRPRPQQSSEAAPRHLSPPVRELLRRLPIFDQRWVEAQLGTAFDSVDEAVDAYLAAPGCTPHPLFFGDWIDQSFGRPPGNNDPLMWYLNQPRVHRGASTHPLLDVDVLLTEHPELRDSPHGPLVAWLEQATADTPVPGPPELRRLTLGELYRVSEAALAEHDADLALRQAPRTSHTPPDDPVDPATVVPPARPDEPLVSVVMPLWNRARQVRGAIESVQAQSFTGWELVVVDDGSQDDSLAVVTGIAHFDDRITVVPQPHGGVCRARNTGLEHARGRYVAFLDTDNRWRPGFLAVMLARLEDTGWSMAHSALRATKDGETYYRAFEGTHEHLLVANHVDLNVLVARTDVVREVGGFDESLRRGVDYDLLLRLAETEPLRLVPYLGVEYVDDQSGAPRISTSEAFEWNTVVSARHLMASHAGPRPREPGLTSVVVRSPGSLRALVRWLRALAGEPSFELVVVGGLLPRWKHVATSVLVRAAVDAKMVRLQHDRGATLAADVGLAASRGERVVWVLDDVHLDTAALAETAAALDDPAVGVAVPVVADRVGTVVAAGAVFAPDSPQPVPFLRGHSTDDLRDVHGLDLPAALGPVLAARGEVLDRVGGLDCLYPDRLAETDLSLRVRREDGGGTRLVTGARLQGEARPAEGDALNRASRLIATHADAVPSGSAAAWAAAGFSVAGYDYPALDGERTGPDDQPVLAPRPRLVPRRPETAAVSVTSVTEGPPSLRWTIDLASPAGEAGRSWGDTHYGEQLADALRRRGQLVAVDNREARHRQSRDLDDVVLVLRGLDHVHPRPGRVNLEWIISHPELVTAEEASGFDAVLAASPTWATEAARAWRVAVEPLLQATDPSLFHPDRAAFDSGAPVLFVGNSRKILRSSLRHARAAGVEVAVHGSGWEPLIGAGRVASRFVPNDELGARYAAAGLVLNDHWEDMRQRGFVSNRLMDAAASGARVASDPLPGIDLTAMFSGLVRTYTDEHELAALVRDRDEVYPDAEGRRAAAAKVAAEHSFDARAERLLEVAVEHVRARGRQ